MKNILKAFNYFDGIPWANQGIPCFSQLSCSIHVQIYNGTHLEPKSLQLSVYVNTKFILLKMRSIWTCNPSHDNGSFYTIRIPIILKFGEAWALASVNMIKPAMSRKRPTNTYTLAKYSKSKPFSPCILSKPFKQCRKIF